MFERQFDENQNRRDERSKHEAPQTSENGSNSTFLRVYELHRHMHTSCAEQATLDVNVLVNQLDSSMDVETQEEFLVKQFTGCNHSINL